MGGQKGLAGVAVYQYQKKWVLLIFLVVENSKFRVLHLLNLVGEDGWQSDVHIKRNG